MWRGGKVCQVNVARGDRIQRFPESVGDTVRAVRVDDKEGNGHLSKVDFDTCTE